MSKPWMKFYPRDWRGDQALRIVSLSARGLWMDMLCLMYEANPFGHLIVGDQPVSDADLARLVGAGTEEVQALLVELLSARVARKTRGGVIYSKRMTEDDKKSKAGRKAKLEALGKDGENPAPSRVPARGASSQRPEARAREEGLNRPSSPSDRPNGFLKEVTGGKSQPPREPQTLAERIALIQQAGRR